MRNPDPGGTGARDRFDRSVSNTYQSSRVPRPNQARLDITAGCARARARFARRMVFEEFKYKHARAIDYDDFIDRKPNQRPRRWRAST